MKTAISRAEPLEEIVFRHRNKTYGAYLLRRDYRKFITRALIFATFFTGAVITYPLVTALNYKPTVNGNKGREVTIRIDSPPKDELPKPEAPKPPEPASEKVRFVPPVIGDSADGNPFGIQSDLADKPIAPVPTEHPVLTVTEEKPVVIEQPEDPTPRTIVQIMPQFPGGDMALFAYLSTHIRYPEAARESGIQGTVHINFIVEKDGSISDVKLLRGIGGGCDEVALEVVRSMPRWTPGIQQGIPVRVSFNLPVRFTLR